MTTEIVRELVDGEWVTAVGSGGGGGGLPDPITTEVNIAPTAATNSLSVKNNEGDVLLLVGDQAGAVLVQLQDDFGDTFSVSLVGGGSIFKVESVDGAANHAKMGFFGHATAVQPTGVAVDAAAIHAALVSLGLITA